MKQYGYRLVPGREQEMTKALGDAIARQEPMVVTGWPPRWMFGRWSLRFLDDPKHVYGSFTVALEYGLDLMRGEGLFGAV